MSAPPRTRSPSRCEWWAICNFGAFSTLSHQCVKVWLRACPRSQWAQEVRRCSRSGVTQAPQPHGTDC